MKYQFFKNVENDDELEVIVNLLKDNSIKYELDAASYLFDKAIVGSNLLPKYTIKLLPSEFENAGKILENYYAGEIDIETDFIHLQELSSEELMSILERPDEWSTLSEVAAKKILKSRKVEISDDDIMLLKARRISKIREGKRAEPMVQIAYFISILIGFYFWLFFILAGFGMGYYYAYGKATDVNGERYFVYDEKSRRNGKLILYGGIICLLFEILIMIYINRDTQKTPELSY